MEGNENGWMLCHFVSSFFQKLRVEDREWQRKTTFKQQTIIAPTRYKIIKKI
jgi:hypothetical protein